MLFRSRLSRSAAWRRLSGSASPTISPTSSPFLPGPTADGSTRRCFAQTVASHKQQTSSPVIPSIPITRRTGESISRTRGGVLGSGLLGSARHASIAVDRIRIAEVSYWRTPISPGMILDLRQIANALVQQQFWQRALARSRQLRYSRQSGSDGSEPLNRELYQVGLTQPILPYLISASI